MTRPTTWSGSRGFTLIELIVVALIIGILAAAAAPLYLGYIKDAKMAEGKSSVGALWTSVQANGVAGCGSPVPVKSAYPRAGFDATGLSTDGRWQAGGGEATVTVDCTSGKITPGASPVFTVTGAVSDISSLQIGLFYDPGPPAASILRCSSDGTAVTSDSPAC